MLLLTLCLLGTALAAPAIPEETMEPAESHVLMSPYIAYSPPILPLRTLPLVFETGKEEKKDELKEETKEPKELLEVPEAPELPKLEEIKPVVVKLEDTKPLSYITNWINSFPSWNLPSLPPFIGSWFPSSNPKVLLPSYYPEYPVSMIVDAAKH